MSQKRCPKCGGRMFLQYGTGYKGNKYEYSCMNCGFTENAGNRLPKAKQPENWRNILRRVDERI